MKRRSFLKGLIASLVVSFLGMRKVGAQGWNGYIFRHGVASGDPDDNSVILWTRVSGATSRPIRVHWEMASDPEMKEVLRHGEAWASDAHDYTVKVDARGLPSGALLYYRFTIGSNVSPVGRTRTLPHGNIDTARFAVVSCANHPYGFFNAYRDIAEQDDLDAVIHLGDYIYEYGLGQYATERAAELGRIPDPPTELALEKAHPDLHLQTGPVRIEQVNVTMFRAAQKCRPVKYGLEQLFFVEQVEQANGGFVQGGEILIAPP